MINDKAFCYFIVSTITLYSKLFGLSLISNFWSIIAPSDWPCIFCTLFKLRFVPKHERNLLHKFLIIAILRTCWLNFGLQWISYSMNPCRIL